MRSQIKFLSTLTALTLGAYAAGAQGTTNLVGNVNTQAVFRVSFAATCQAFDSSRGRVVTTHLTERNIIAQAVGLSPANHMLTRNFALAYNATEDSLQVVDTNLTPIVDVIHFGGGAAIADSRQLSRFTFLFFPGQTNEFGAETNVVGSAVIAERPNRGGRAVPSIQGRLQFLLTGGNVLGMTNPSGSGTSANMGGTNGVGATVSTLTTNGTGGVAAANNQGIFSNVLSGGSFVMTSPDIVFDPSAQICVGTFTTTGRATAGSFPTAPSGTGTTTNTTTTSTNTTGVTNGTTGISTTNGTVVGGAVVFNPVTGTTTTVPSTTIGTGTVGVVPGTTGTGTVGITTTPGVSGITTSPGVSGITTSPGVSGITTSPGVSGITTTPGVMAPVVANPGVIAPVVNAPVVTTPGVIMPVVNGTTGSTGATTGTPIIVGP